MKYNNLPLNEVLLDLSAKYNIQVSINAVTSGGCLVTVDQEFKTKTEALASLAEMCHLEIKRVGEVYSFVEKEEEVTKKKKPIYYLYQGEVLDDNTLEPLPYAKIMIGDNGLIADEQGRFSLRSENQSESISIKYLGYFLKDSIVKHNRNLQFSLKAQNLELSAVIVDTSNYIYRSQISDQGGKTRFNDITQTLIPGGSNNWMFNYMRLYPGIMAAGESVSDYIIWGSYSGQNHIIFDGITLFNSISVSNEIGRVNPSIIKSLDVYNGGYNVDIGDRTGGVLLINGKSGNKTKASGNVSLNNQVANIYFDLPLFKKTSSLQLSARKSFELFDFQKSNFNEENSIRPEFDFSDLNVKFTTRFKNKDLLQISSIASADKYSFSFENKQAKDYAASLNSGSEQVGTSLKYVHNFKKRGISTITFAHSNYQSFRISDASFKDSLALDEKLIRNSNWTNKFNEYSAKYHHSFSSFKRNTFQFSASYIRNEFKLFSNETLSNYADKRSSINRLSGFVKDKIQLNKRIQLDLGLKLDMPFNSLKPYLQPRVNGKIDLTEKMAFSFGSGIYYQFASQATFVDSLGGESSSWVISDGVEVPIQSAMHNVIGFSYSAKKIEIGLNAYHKIMKGLSRYYINADSTFLDVGDATAMGSDLFIKYRIKKHEVWASYSIVQVQEEFGINESSLAPQSQLHELKTAAVFNFHPFYFSAASVFGSGVQTTIFKDNQNHLPIKPYLRTDIAFQYKFKTDKLNFETGFSIVNLFNNRNYRISQFTSFPDGTVASTRGTHFTPSIFFNVRF